MPTSTGGTEAGQARTLRLFAPAKINLALEVIGRRDDDFHDLDTVMTTLALGDEVRLGPCDGLDVRFSGRHAAGVGADDLCTRAALALARAAGRISNVTIEVTKRIPVAAGLGGGSSDAAAVLRGLNKLWGLDWPLERLTGIAAELGSDVPFFLYGGTARCTGRGEMVEPLRDMRPLQLLLLQPPVPLAASLARHAPPPSRDLVNTFEAVIERSDPELLMHYVSYRAAGVPQLHLCGAGPTLYVLVSKRAQLAALHRGFEAAGAEVIETATLPRDEATAVTVEQADA
ncbi:MAG: 4-(cytidine 5'-diphospho)-2-C-methyl-D-erythritol kinase [Dehalococcoidia bacterium]|jgi:4-diphosphocytidyl-2-C-methyl-D-erythritol kinase|nr:4-(cytidine 5'-diphospho)-2-C-methyl-D-erythritol kinase [Dehalococcoidia bacterium]